MALAVNINELILGRVIEWVRLEFKKKGNPGEVSSSMHKKMKDNSSTEPIFDTDEEYTNFFYCATR